MGAITEALAPVVKMLSVEGFDLAVDETGPASAVLTVSARPEACEYCLVPKSVLQSVAADKLAAHGLTAELSVVYPIDYD
ncbi:MAG: hypothetical protein AB7L13_00370 [Acidimicrobiia bacterium]